MTDNYTKIVQANLAKLYETLPHDLAGNLPGEQEENRFKFEAFGETCTLSPEKITLGQEAQSPILGILISLYALNANPNACKLAPFKAFKELPDSMPYIGAFTTHTEQILVPHVLAIKENVNAITRALGGGEAPADMGGDFSFMVKPLPKIGLSYIFYEADEDFPASVTCLYSHNAEAFLPIDGLADVGEYTSKAILKLIA